MENLNWKRSQILDGVYESMGLRPDVSLQMIAADDIGAFAALAFEDPQAYVGQGLEIAGDELTEPEAVSIMGQVIGRDVGIAPAPPPPTEDWALMVGFFNNGGYQADIPALRAIHPGLMMLETWLRENGWQGTT